MTATEFALRTDGVGKRYRKGWALRDCTLTLPAGGVIALVGPNGAGKTTLLRLIVGLLAPSTGTVEVLGHDVTAEHPANSVPGRFPGPGPPAVQALHRRRDAPLRPVLQPAVRPGLAERRLAKLGIPLDRRAGTLSGGQQAQVALALALAKRPDLLVLDEPVASLDPPGAGVPAPAVRAERHGLVGGGGMTWLIWRQHRTEVCVLVLLVGMFGIVLLVLGTQAHDLFPGGPARCAGQAGYQRGLRGLLPPAYALFAFAVATAAGDPAAQPARVRRRVRAFLAARLPVALLARPAYATPLTTMEPVPVGGSRDQAGRCPRPASLTG